MPMDTTDNQLLGFFRGGSRRIMDPLMIMIGLVACILAALYLENIFARVAVCIVASLCTIGAMIWAVTKSSKRKQADEENMVHLPTSSTLPKSPEDEPDIQHNSPILQRHHSGKRCSHHHNHNHERRPSHTDVGERRHSHCAVHGEQKDLLTNGCEHSPDSPDCSHTHGLSPGRSTKRCSRHGSRSPKPEASPRHSTDTCATDANAESINATET